MEWWAVGLAVNLVLAVTLLGLLVAIGIDVRRAGSWRAMVHRKSEVETLRQRQRQALDIHDNVVQGLVMAKLSFELGETDAGMAAVDQTLAAARSFVTDLLGDPDIVDLRNGALRRSIPAGPN
jgi:signal transduction histidine kinase